jgi:hypothetical protein
MVNGWFPKIAMTEQLPERTLFFSLRAKGLGTAFVEGLTGYMMRLARAHRVTVADLVCHDHFDRLFVNPSDRRTRRRLFLASGYLLDGAGPNTQKWVEALEAATGQSGLRSLTLSQFAGVSSFSWLRRTRTWCPRCLSVQADTDPDDMYEPLFGPFASCLSAPRTCYPWFSYVQVVRRPRDHSMVWLHPAIAAAVAHRYGSPEARSSLDRPESRDNISNLVLRARSPATRGIERVCHASLAARYRPRSGGHIWINAGSKSKRLCSYRGMFQAH